MQKSTTDSITVFFPAFNEERNITKTVEDAITVLKKIAQRWEIIVINDGSTDGTKIKVDSLRKKYKEKIRLINHSENKGYGEALKSGFYSANYDWIVTIDADGQFDFADVTKLLVKAKQGHDVVIGYRLDRKDSLVRKINGLGWTLLANLLLGINVRDVDCSFKLVKRKVITSIPRLESTRGGMISPELLAKAKKHGFVIGEVGVQHFARKHGKQTGANMRVIVTSVVNLVKLWKKLR